METKKDKEIDKLACARILLVLKYEIPDTDKQILIEQIALAATKIKKGTKE